MSTTKFTNAATGSSYWTCTRCGNIVNYGVTHSCPTTTWTWPPYPPAQTTTRIDWTPQLLALGNRIADILERLVAAIERENPHAS